ncbi:AbrB/MazE/SpoVT family DNA-binding domain-containing protein [Pseudomonas sp. dw_358]|uniref:AbrB/MazE/SpoVT family DNA-binding domain-containing protein n=1 Tax=Pseudomonas sp. dw_358 TaxID=2720083 RepID=UPI001BD6D434|nr:AbrB/MazE/SpoVT family DNA-binding domain-containing protein [Pseudomonas sp. dw_358]
MQGMKLIIEDWDGDGALRLPDEVLQELGVDVGDSLYIVEADAAAQTLVLSTRAKVRDRLDDLLEG